MLSDVLPKDDTSATASVTCLDKLNELLKTNGIESIANDASAALAAAIRTSHDSIALALIAAGVPVNLAGDYQPLFEAARWHRYDLMEALIKAGADPNRKDSRGASWLATLGYFDATATKILLKAGADPSARDRYGATALMHASEAGYEEEVKLLLDHNADPNLRDNQGRTALMYAAQGKYVDSIPLLLDHGADPNSRDGEGHTAIDIAKTAGNTTAVKLIGKATGVSK